MNYSQNEYLQHRTELDKDNYRAKTNTRIRTFFKEDRKATKGERKSVQKQ